MVSISWCVLLLHGVSSCKPLVKRATKLVVAPARPASASFDVRSGYDLTQHLLHHKKRRNWKRGSAALWWAMDERRELLEPMHFNVVISTLAAAQPEPEWERALLLLDQMSSAGLRPDAFSYSAAISACSRAGQVERALAVFKQCASDHAEGPNGVVFNAILAACQRGGAPWRAQLLALFASMGAHGVQPDAWAHSAAIDALSKSGRWERALELVTDLEQLGAAGGTRPDSYVYGAAMRACARQGQWRSVLTLHGRMREHGVAPTAHTLSTALAACAADPDGLGWQAAHRLLEAERRSSRSVLNVHCYTAAAKAYACGGRWREATALLAEMRQFDVWPNARTYTAVIESLGPPLRWQQALDLLYAMRADDGVQPDGHAVHAALRVVGKAGQWEAAAELVRNMHGGLRVRPTAVHATSCIGILLHAGQVAEARELLRELLHSRTPLRPDAGLCDVGLGVCARHGDGELALELVERLRAEKHALTPRMRRCAVVALCRAATASEYEPAVALLPPLPADDEAEAVACYSAVLHAMLRAGDAEHADELRKRMRTHGLEPRTIEEVRARER